MVVVIEWSFEDLQVMVTKCVEHHIVIHEMKLKDFDFLQFDGNSSLLSIPSAY